LNPPLLQDTVGSHIHGSIGGILLEAKAFNSHRHSRWYIHAEATKKKGLSHSKKCGSLLTCPPIGGLFLRMQLKTLKMLGFIKKQKAPHLLVNGVQW